MTRGSRALALIGAVLVVAGGVAGTTHWRRSTEERERDLRMRTVFGDTAAASLQRAVASMRSRDSTFANALAGRALPKGAPTVEESRVQRAVTSLSFASVHDRNLPALALVASGEGTSAAGTAFGISADGQLLTSRHVLQVTPNPGARVRVKYSGTAAWLPAHVVRASDTFDLALVQIDARGRYPSVVGMSHNGLLARVGAPVASIGYPGAATAPPTMTAGMVSALGSDLLQIEAYAGTAASGAPVFDARGDVVGVVTGVSGTTIIAQAWTRLAGFLSNGSAGGRSAPAVTGRR